MRCKPSEVAQIKAANSNLVRANILASGQCRMPVSIEALCLIIEQRRADPSNMSDSMQRPVTRMPLVGSVGLDIVLNSIMPTAEVSLDHLLEIGDR